MTFKWTGAIGNWFCDQCQTLIAKGRSHRDSAVCTEGRSFFLWGDFEFCTYKCMMAFNVPKDRKPPVKRGRMPRLHDDDDDDDL